MAAAAKAKVVELAAPSTDRHVLLRQAHRLHAGACLRLSNALLAVSAGVQTVHEDDICHVAFSVYGVEGVVG